MNAVFFGGLALVLLVLYPTCHTPYAPSNLPTYSTKNPTIDNDDWSGSVNQAEWKERPGLNESAMHQMITGRQHPYHGF